MMWLRKSIFFTGFFAVLMSSCGRSYVGEKVKLSVSGIIHGEKVNKEDYSFVAKIQSYDETICSAIIISETKAITAAHCLLNQNAIFITNAQTTKLIESAEIHPKFNFNKNNYSDYDIAILNIVDSNTSFNISHYPTITNKKTSAGSLIAVAYGLNEKNEFQGLASKVVQKKRISKKCYRSDKKIIATTQVLNRADSGGALVRKVSEDNYELVGLASAYYDNRRCDAASLFTNIGHHYKWLQEVI